MQLMPEFYPHVNRRDPAEALRAGAMTMQQHLQTWNGDVRKALASYNAGLGAVESAVARGGTAWEFVLPKETRDYLAAIVGNGHPVFLPAASLSLLPGGASTTGFPPAGIFGAGGPGAATRSGLTGSLWALGGLDRLR